MAVISGGNIIRNTTQTPGSKPRMLPWEGAPVAGTSYAGLLTHGDLVVDVVTKNVHEYKAAGTNEVQTVSITGAPTGGTFTLTFNAQTTAAIAFDATAAAVRSALEALSTIGSGNVTSSGGPLPGTAVTVTFVGALARQDVAQMTATSALTGGVSPAVSVATTAAGSAVSPAESLTRVDTV